MRFAELTDKQWEFIKPHLPPQPIVGRKRADDRRTINGILYVLNTGCRGMICLDATAHIKLLGAGSSGGQETAFGKKFLKLLKSMLTQLEN
jgi:transposase